MDRDTYRGKRLDNGRWAYGYYCFQRARRGGFGQQITADDFDRHLIVQVGGVVVDIDPTTKGQCTGLQEKNGRWIFEGDRIRITNNRDASIHKINEKLKDGESFETVVQYEPGVFCANCQPMIFYGRYVSSIGFMVGYCEKSGFDCVVIGNIHDNAPGEETYL